MIRAVIGDGVFGLSPAIDEQSVTCWRLLIKEASVLGKPCELKDVDTNAVVAVVLLPDSADQVSDNLALTRIL